MKRITVILSAIALTAGAAAITPAFAKTNTTSTTPKASKMVAATKTCKSGYQLDKKTDNCVKATATTTTKTKTTTTNAPTTKTTTKTTTTKTQTPATTTTTTTPPATTTK